MEFNLPLDSIESSAQNNPSESNQGSPRTLSHSNDLKLDMARFATTEPQIRILPPSDASSPLRKHTKASYSNSTTNLRRSAGLFNLQLQAPTPSDPPGPTAQIDQIDHIDQIDRIEANASAGPERPVAVFEDAAPEYSQPLHHRSQHQRGSQLLKPTQLDRERLGYSARIARAHQKHNHGQVLRPTKLNLKEPKEATSLKRPHPFGSSRPSFLAPGSPISKSPALASSPKRLHVPHPQLTRRRGSFPVPLSTPQPSIVASTSSDDASWATDDRMTPDSSFRGAKPLQTAFTSTGLQSKVEHHRDKNTSQSSLQIPETPCKPLAPTPDISNRPLNLGERMERFSLSHIEDDLSELRESPSTPTRGDISSISRTFSHSSDAVQTSTPLVNGQYHLGANGMVATRVVSDAATVTPGTVRAVHRPLGAILDPLDDSDIGSLSTESFSSPRSSPKTPDLGGNSRNALMEDGTQLVGSSSMESASSPQPQRHRLRLQSHIPLKMAPPPVDISGSSEFPGTPGPRTPGHRSAPILAPDITLTQRFETVLPVGSGEFSMVYMVGSEKQRFAVKRTKKPGQLRGLQSRQRRQEEIGILRELTGDRASVSGDDDERRDFVVHLVDAWEAQGFGYIMTEFCENGDLDRFLAEQGSVSRLEEWRVWKILAELSWGVSYIHSHDILHLDLKPANVFITFEGQLKIGDFGMATKWPTAPGFEREGDREYIAPEVLEFQRYGKPADIFSMGIMMVEIAANIVLPENGIHWQRLRSGDLSDAGRLSSGDLRSVRSSGFESASSQPAPHWAPQFLTSDSRALDSIVSAMLSPEPSKRPTASQLMSTQELLLVTARRQAGAIVYEGEYGPAPCDVDEPTWRR